MPTQRQKKVAELIIQNATLDKPLNGREMLAKVSYSKGIQIQPSRILESPGVIEALEIAGFNPNAAKSVVAEIMHDINNEPNSRLKAADQVFKVHGSYAAEKREIDIKGEIVNIIDPKIIALAEKYEEELKKNL